MQRNEQVIFLLPLSVRELRRAALSFQEQFGVYPLMHVQGHVYLEREQPCEIRHRCQLARWDEELDIFGLGEVGELREDLVWIHPSERQTLLCLSTPTSFT